MAMTTKSSTRVKARALALRGFVKNLDKRKKENEEDIFELQKLCNEIGREKIHNRPIRLEDGPLLNYEKLLF
jgi:hypothetical protein